MCRLNSFCYCLSLRLGVVIAAVLTVLYSIFLITFGAIAITDPEQVNLGQHNHNIIGGLYITMGIVAFIIFCFLIMGLVQKKAALLMPWLVCAMLQIVVGSVNVIVLLAMGNWMAVLSALFLAGYVYFWIIVHSYYLIVDKGYEKAETSEPM